MSTPTLEDLESDCRQLYHLLDTIVEIRVGAPSLFDRERHDALIWIARDLAERIKADAAALVEPEDGPRMVGGERHG